MINDSYFFSRLTLTESQKDFFKMLDEKVAQVRQIDCFQTKLKILSMVRRAKATYYSILIFVDIFCYFEKTNVPV